MRISVCKVVVVHVRDCEVKYIPYCYDRKIRLYQRHSVLFCKAQRVTIQLEGWYLGCKSSGHPGMLFICFCSTCYKLALQFAWI